jgi:O-antigen/teichoic acid export membrane protein
MFKKLLSFLTDSLTFGLSGVLGQLIGFIMLPIYTQFLTPNDYGVLAMSFVITAFFSSLASLGMNSAVFRYFREETINQDKLISTAFVTVFISSTILLLLCEVFLSKILYKILLESNIRDGLWIMQITLFSSYLTTISSVLNTAFRAERKTRMALLVNVIYIICQTLLSIVLVVLYKMGLLGMIYGQLFGQIIVFVVLIFLLMKNNKLYLNLTLFKLMINYGLYIVPANLLNAVMEQLGQYMIKSTLSLKMVGLYGIAGRIAAPIQIVGSSMTYAHTAFFFQILKEDNPKKYLRALVSYYITFLTYLWVAVSIWGVEILRLLTPPEFHGASVLIAPIALIPLLFNVWTFYASGIDSGENLRPYLFVNLTGVIVFGISLYVMIDKFGVIGAAYATIFTRIVMIIVSHYFSQKRLEVNYNTILVIAVVLSGIIAIFINNLWSHEGFFYRIAAALITSLVFPLLCIGILAIFPIERLQMLNFAHNAIKRRNKKI